MKKINFKQPKYILPIVALPFGLFIGYQILNFMNDKDTPVTKKEELSISLGDTQDSILTKNDAYDEFFEKKDDRTMLDGLEKEEDSMNIYEDNLSATQKRYIDSLKAARKAKVSSNNPYNRKNYYNENRSQDSDFQRSKQIMNMLNNQSIGNSKTKVSEESISNTHSRNEKEDPVNILRRQMMMMDSIEKSKDPELQAKIEAEKKLKKNKENFEKFLNTTMKVSKYGDNNTFNWVTKDKSNSYIKAIIDEDTKGYLGSRIRIRLLEDIFVGKNKINQGTVLYGEISGFGLQRVILNIVAVMEKGNILPINLAVYDLDGIKGLYVPESTFREMMREFGSNSLQGNPLNSKSESFFSSMFSSLFSSTSQTIANLIRKNKVSLKYNSYILLINEKENN